jgi:hypothetical protein
MQTALVILLISGAAAYLGVRFYKTWAGKQQKGCEKCGTKVSDEPDS